VPPALSKVHNRFKTPYIAIIVFSLIAIVILLPGFFATDVFAEMGALYAVGSLLAFMFAHASIISLRIRRPELPRPFKLGWNIHIKGRELPISAIIGFLSTFLIWLVILIIEPYSRWVGIGWMVVGLVIYYLYQRHRKKASMIWKPDSEKSEKNE
jgi:APA family basic amino acid/polyamine antiporter